MQRLRVRRMSRIGLCAALMSVCAWICVPAAVPFTLQSFAVLLGAALLRGWDGPIAVLVYLALGAVGLPVFSGMRGGVGVLAGPTGGFLFGFLLASAVMGLLQRLQQRGVVQLLFSMVLAQCVCYLCGTLWFALQADCGIAAAISACVLPYLLPDTIKLLLAVWLSQRLRSVL